MKMKKWFNILTLGLVASLILSGCGLNDSRGELTGVPGRSPWYHPQPYGTVYIPTGSFHMGMSDQDIMHTLTARPKQVTVQAFYIDDTEITNNEYRQFVYYIKDSIAKMILGGDHLIADDYGNERVNWRKRIDWSDPDVVDMLGDMYYPEADMLTKNRELNPHVLKYKYKWLDLQEAAKYEYIDNENYSRKDFIREEEIKVYPDTLTFIRDFTYSFNEPLAQAYFWHPSYDNYPVVGVDWFQANGFCHWRTEFLNTYYSEIGEPIINPFRLPSEAEWEYAARGGREHSPYPWGGPYTRNSKGCFLANFKPLRGNYMEDGGLYPVKVTSYFPNDFGLYCMSGNVAEWTSTAYDPSLYAIVDDLNPDYRYDAGKDEPDAMQRKVIRGGSWKDVAFYIQVGTRTYEYQDTAKSYVGFRTVMTYMGRSNKDR